MSERKPMRHDLKTWLPYFDAIVERRKKFEIRVNDRDYREGDWLRLIPYDQSKRRAVRRHGFRHYDVEVTYVMSGGQFGLDPSYVVMSIRDDD